MSSLTKLQIQEQMSETDGYEWALTTILSLQTMLGEREHWYCENCGCERCLKAEALVEVCMRGWTEDESEELVVIDPDVLKIVQGLKVAIMDAIAILDNDLYVSRAINARNRLQEVIDEYGEPEDS